MTNIAELLKDAPKGMKLYSPLFGEVEFVEVDRQSDYPINVTDCKGNGKSFTEFGIYLADHPDAECLLFPSKECRTWENFKLSVEPKFKVGDWVVFNDSHNSIYQISEIKDYCYMLTHTRGGSMSLSFSQEKLIRPWTIQDARNGDVLVTDFFIFLFKKVDYANGVHYYCHCGAQGEEFDIALPDSLMGRVGNSLVNYRPTTKEQRDLLFAKIREAGYKWDEKKKELKKIKVHYDIANFHAGMPVLVRDKDNRKWCYLLYSHYDNTYDDGLCFNAGSVDWRQCIPFEGNEALLGTTDMCDEQYINW